MILWSIYGGSILRQDTFGSEATVLYIPLPKWIWLNLWSMPYWDAWWKKPQDLKGNSLRLCLYLQKPFEQFKHKVSWIMINKCLLAILNDNWNCLKKYGILGSNIQPMTLRLYPIRLHSRLWKLKREVPPPSILSLYSTPCLLACYLCFSICSLLQTSLAASLFPCFRRCFHPPIWEADWYCVHVAKTWDKTWAFPQFAG